MEACNYKPTSAGRKRRLTELKPMLIFFPVRTVIWLSLLDNQIFFHGIPITG